MKSAAASLDPLSNRGLQPLAWRESMIRLLQGHEEAQSTIAFDVATDAETLVSCGVKDKWTNFSY
jgi:hypothetical protein